MIPLASCDPLETLRRIGCEGPLPCKVEATQNTMQSSSTYQEETSGLGRSGLTVTVGSNKLATTDQESSVTNFDGHGEGRAGGRADRGGALPRRLVPAGGRGDRGAWRAAVSHRPGHVSRVGRGPGGGRAGLTLSKCFGVAFNLIKQIPALDMPRPFPVFA